MGFGRKVGAFLGLVPDEQHEYLENEEFDADYPAPRRREYRETDFDAPAYDRYADRDPARLEPLRASGRSFGTEPAVQGALAIKPEPVLRREPEVSTGNRPVTVKLTGFAEARVIGEKYRDGQSVILDMTDMSDSDARRLVDFSAGLAFSLHGSIDRVAPKVFMLLPPDADVAAAAHAAGFATTAAH